MLAPRTRTMGGKVPVNLASTMKEHEARHLKQAQWEAKCSHPRASTIGIKSAQKNTIKSKSVRHRGEHCESNSAHHLSENPRWSTMLLTLMSTIMENEPRHLGSWRGKVLAPEATPWRVKVLATKATTM